MKQNASDVYFSWHVHPCFSTARGKKKKIKQLLPLLALAKLKITALIPLLLGVIAFAAVKAVFLAKIALLVAGIIALKKLLSHKSHESYEVVAHPHHEEHYPSSGHGWGRSVDDAQNLAYAAHVKSDWIWLSFVKLLKVQRFSVRSIYWIIYSISIPRAEG